MQLKTLPEVMSCRKKLKKLLNNKIVDIFLFGSLVKGGFAKDIDIAMLVEHGVDVARLKETVRQVLPAADVQFIDVESVYSPLWLTLIREGFSVRKGQFLSSIYGIKPVALFKYSLKKLNAVQKVQFSRGLKNTLVSGGTVLTRTVVLVPINLENRIKDFLKRWNIYYESMEYELLPVLRKEEFV